MKQLAVALLIIAAGFATSAQPEKLFRIGMTQAEMHAAFGVPQSYLDVEAQRRLTRKEYLAKRDTCACRPLYSRKTAGNEYEIMVFEKDDDSASRLHPVVKVKEVRFTLDHDMAPEEALEDIAEAKALCSGHCTIQHGRFGDATATRPEIGVQFNMLASSKNPAKVAMVGMSAKK